MLQKFKPYNPSQNDLKGSWRVIDATDKILGRLASEVAVKLMGKDKPGYASHLLSGDFVVVTNAARVKVTGRKADQMVYVRHNQYPGHRKEVPYAKEISLHSDRVIRHAVRGMLPRTKLGDQMITRLKVYPGPEHPHSAQVRGAAANKPSTGGETR
ncbi:MAG: 50S ribosomal protein L13 [Chloroflexi bacterium]|nr:50S ribosomal protein L13 [Chloroflexota bacterium]